MTITRPNYRLVSQSRSFSEVASLVVLLIGLLVLVGWVFDIALLKSFHPDLITIKVNTAIGLISTGGSLWLLQRKRDTVGPKRRLAQACALFVAVLGLLTLVEYLLSLDLGIDQLLLKEPLEMGDMRPPGRMAPTSALSFFLGGLALLLIDAKPFRVRWAQLLALVVGLISSLSLVGFVYGLSVFQMGSFTDIALPTAVGFVVFCLGVLGARPDRGLTAVVVSENAGGSLARRLLPTIILVPLVLDVLTLVGRRAGLYHASSGSVIHVVSVICFLAALILMISRSLDRADASRKAAEEEIRSLNADLERRVDARTLELEAANRDLRNEIAQRRWAERELQRYKLLAARARDIMLFIANDGRIVEANDAAAQAYGYAVSELTSMTVYDLRAPGTQSTIAAQIAEADAKGILFETMHRRKDGTTFPVEVSSQGTTIGHERVLLSVVRDITTRKRLEQQLAFLAMHDYLTKLPNRRALEDALERAVARAGRGHESALLFLDVDNFKLINDTLGHAAGDQALVSLSRLLQDHLRAEDVLARLGGDEFVVLLEDSCLEDARGIAERLRQAVEESRLLWDGHTLSLSLSIGLAAVDARRTPVELLAQADRSMYAAKEQCRDAVALGRQ